MSDLPRLLIKRLNEQQFTSDKVLTSRKAFMGKRAGLQCLVRFLFFPGRPFFVGPPNMYLGNGFLVALTAQPEGA